MSSISELLFRRFKGTHQQLHDAEATFSYWLVGFIETPPYSEVIGVNNNGAV
jgi:hypothetical protein